MTLDEALEIANGCDPRREKSWKEMVEIIRDHDGEEVRVTTVEDTYVGELDVSATNPLKRAPGGGRPGLLNVFLNRTSESDFEVVPEIISDVAEDKNDRYNTDYYYERLTVFNVFLDEEGDVEREEFEKILDIEPV